MNYRQPLAAKCLLWIEAGDMAVAMAAVNTMAEEDVADVMAAADVTDVVAADLTAVADTEAAETTVVDVVTASQDQPLSSLRPALTKTLLTA